MLQTKVSVFEKAVILDHPIFFIGGGAEATSRSTPLFKMEQCIIFDGIIADFKTNSATYNTKSF